MTPEEILRIRQRLVALYAEAVLAGDQSVRGDGLGAVPSAADQDEQPFREMDQAIASNRNKVRSEQLARIADALRRLDESPDSFGLCEVCEDEIPARRLELLPFVRRCVACQTRAETRSGKPVRRKVTDYHD